MGHILTAIHNSTGYLYQGCPWKVFDDPLVADVMDAHPYLKAGNLGVFLGPHPSMRLVEAVGLYEQTLQKLLNDERKKADDKAKADSDRHSAAMSARGARRG